MSHITTTTRTSSPAGNPSNPNRRVRASFARAAVFAEFGRAAFALDQADFVDRLPGETPARAPEAGFAE